MAELSMKKNDLFRRQVRALVREGVFQRRDRDNKNYRRFLNTHAEAAMRGLG